MNVAQYFISLCVVVGISAISNLATAQQDAAEQKREEYMIARQAHALLARWISDGTASGLNDVWWDNCDGGHSRVNLEQLPGMNKYTDSRWGLQIKTRSKTTVGNSSTAHKEIERGSQTRGAYSAPFGLKSLRNQYRGNNVYIYPSHMDHIAGNQRLGKGQTKKIGEGRGDMFPTNTPFAITSLGSSGSDKPFIRAMAWTIGSFRPDVREYLEKYGLLIPTVQMLLRRTQRHLNSPNEYLTGKAHPSVFDRRNLNPLAMMRAAHQMQLKDIPALIQLKVINEDVMVPGVDFIGPKAMSEKLFDSPEVIARIWRGYPITRTMVVSAEDTINPSKLPLSFRWEVLRGDPAGIDINRLEPDGARVEITVSYPVRHNSTGIEGMWSNRIDIGVFAVSRRSVSVPGFITWMGLDYEEREYDESERIKAIDYDTHRFVDPRLGKPGNYRDEFLWDDGRIVGITRRTADNNYKSLGPDGKPNK